MAKELNNASSPLSPVGAKIFGADASGNAGFMAHPARPNTCVIFGDSITAQNRYAAATVEAIAARHFGVANAASGHRLILIKNAGVSSDTTAQMLARLSSDVLSYSPGYVVVLGGTNDKNVGIVAGDESTNGTTIYNLNAIYDRIIKSGAFLFACTLMTRSDLVSSGLASTHAKINNWIRGYVAENVNCTVVDFEAAMSDPATGMPKTEYLLPSDVVHPSARGAYLAGMALAEKIADVVPLCESSVGSIYDHLEYCHNPLLVGANADGVNGSVLVSGTSGTLPNGMQSTKRNSGSAVFSQTTNSAIVPGIQWRTGVPLRCVASFAAAHDGAGLYFGGSDISTKGRYDQNWASSTAYTHGDRKNPTTANGLIYSVITPGTTGSSSPDWASHTEGDIVVDGSVVWIAQKKPAEGDKFYAECDVALSGLTAHKGALPVLDLSVIDTTSTLLFAVYDLYHNIGTGADFYPQKLPGYVRLRTPVMTLPSFGANNIRYLRARLMAYGDAAGTLTMDVHNVAIRRVV